MIYKISFLELAKLQKEILSKQSPPTLEKAKAQVQMPKSKSSSKSRKQRHYYTIANNIIFSIQA